MTIAIDLVTLSWCVGEIRQSFAQAQTLLEKQLAAEPEDLANLRSARAQVHQAHGALIVLDLPGVSMLTREIESVLDAVDSNAVSLSGVLVSRLTAAMQACVECLEDLAQGQPYQPLYLFPYIKVLAEARSAERIHPADLFAVDLSRNLPPVSREDNEIDAEQLEKAKQGFETGLLRYLREPGSDRGVEYMFSAVNAVERSNIAGSNRNFWRVVLAFFDALRTKSLPPDVYSRKLLARINMQLRQTIDRSAPIADRLFRDTLFSLAYAKGGSPIVDQVRRVYELDGVVPDDFEAPRYGKHDVRAVRAAREALTRAKVSWDKVMRGANSEMAAVGNALDAFLEAVEQLPGTGMKALAQGLQQTRRALAAPNALADAKSAPIALELATAILFAEQVLEQGGRAGEQYDPQAGEMAKRLDSAAQGRSELLGDVPNWLRAFSRAAQERLTMTTFVAETLSNLRGVEKDLDTYFRDPAKTQQLPDAIRSLNQVSGAMTLLGHQDAATAAQVAAGRVTEFVQATDTPPVLQFERLAASLGALGFFVEGLLQPERQNNEYEFDADSGEFKARPIQATRAPRSIIIPIEAVGAAEVLPAAAVSNLSEQQALASDASQDMFPVIDVSSQDTSTTLPAIVALSVDSQANLADVSGFNLPESTVSLSDATKANAIRTESLLASLAQTPENPTVRGELREALEQVRSDALLHDDSELKRKASAAIDLLEGSQAFNFDALSASVSSFSSERARPEIAATVLPESEAQVDSELLEIFLAEAQEVVQAIEDSLAILRDSPGDQEHLTTIRRSFHTLKGSSRMVGLNSFGEAGWAMEQVMNLWLSQEKAGSSQLFELIEWSNGYFSAWTAALAANPRVLVQPAAVINAAEQFRAGETPVMPPLGADDPQALSPTQLEMVEVAAVADEFNLQVLSEPADSSLNAKASADEIELELLAPEAAPDLSVDLTDFGFDMDSAIAGMGAALAAEPGVPSRAPPVDLDEFVLIGNRTVSRPLYMIFLGEADDLVAKLVADSAIWRTEKNRTIAEPVVRAAHSLKGSSTLVGLEDVHQIAKLLESIYLRLNAGSYQLSPAQAQTIIASVDLVAHMLHQFAGGREPSCDSQIIADLSVLESQLKPPPPIQEPVDEAVEPADDLVRSEVHVDEDTELSESVDAVPDSSIHDELDPDLLPIFIEEAQDYLPQIGEDLRRWAQNPSNLEPAHNLMRAMHTVKGSARMAGAMVLGQHVHEMETQIEGLLILQSVPLDMIEALNSAHDHTVALFEQIKNPTKSPAASTSKVQPQTQTLPAQSLTESVVERPATAAPATNQAPAAQLVRVRADLLDRLVNDAGEVSIARSRLDNELSTMRQSLGDLTENVNRLRTQLREIEIQAESQIQARYAQQREQDRSFDPLEFDRFTRFQELARMLAEAVNDVATVQQNTAKSLDGASQDLLRQGQVLRELQQNLMRVRMVQIGTISDRMYRVVRQAAKDVDKRVNLDLHGSSAEIDRGVLEKMAGPIEHLLRNAVAHGIESRAERLAAGKAEAGEIRVDVRQEGNEIVLSFADDGKGLDVERIKARAIKHGLIAENAQLTVREAADLIFSPGFSTAETITELSGRGVGMDVVRAETIALGGRIDTESVAGKGTRFIVRLPLTLAIAQVVIVSAGEKRFAIASSSVEQVIQLKANALTGAYADRGVQWQGNKLPLAYLGTLLQASEQKPLVQHYSPIIIVRSGLQRLALHVDEISRNQEVVVKNVGPQIAQVRGVSGATVMGNGEILLIINPVVMAEAAGDVFENSERLIEPLKAEIESLPATIMVVDDSVTVRKVTQRLLSRERFDVMLAKDGVDALRQLQDTLPDLMLVDIEMPRMDGFDLTRHIRADERFKHIPIIMITSRTADKHRNYAKTLGVNVYLGKPFVEEELLGHIRSFVDVARNQVLTA